MRDKQNLKACYVLLGLLFLVSSCQDEEPLEMDTDQNVALQDLSALPQNVEFPANNPYSLAKQELGRLLFWDPVLSGEMEVSCATCHHPNFAFADGRELSSGVEGLGLGPDRLGGALVMRNSPSILNTAFNGIDRSGIVDPEDAPMFWDNRASGLEEQALMPILSAEEMRGEEIAEDEIVEIVIERLNAIPTYRTLFADAFGDENVSEERIVQSLATFQRSLIANNSPFDEYMRGNTNAMSNQEIEGMETFIEVGCVNCHNGPMFSDFELHTLSVPNHPLVDDDGANGDFDFRTPSLRNLDFTAPYMHNGIFEDLRDVLEFYNDISRGNGDSQNPNVNDNQIDEDARDLDIDNGDINDIIMFLNALNDEDFDNSIPNSVPSELSVGGLIN